MTGLSACLLTGLPAGRAGLHGSQPPQGGLSASEVADSRLSQSVALDWGELTASSSQFVTHYPFLGRSEKRSQTLLQKSQY